MILGLINKIFWKRKQSEIFSNETTSDKQKEDFDCLRKKIHDYSVSVLLGKGRAVNIIDIHCDGSESDGILNFDDAELFFKKKFGKKIVYSNSYIPYHFLVTKSGEIFEGMPLYSPAISFSGHFNDGISICYLGGIDKSKEQENSISWLVSNLKSYLSIKNIINE